MIILPSFTSRVIDGFGSETLAYLNIMGTLSRPGQLEILLTAKLLLQYIYTPLSWVEVTSIYNFLFRIEKGKSDYCWDAIFSTTDNNLPYPFI